MNYQRIYNEIVQKSLNENRSKYDARYYESHHIIPKCLGGSNEKHNIVLLTFREHFICHHLLCKIHKKDQINYYKLSTALRRMCSKNDFQNRRIHSKHYEIAKRHERNAKKGIAVGGAKIKNRSQEWKTNISKSLTGRENIWMKNKTYEEIYKPEDLERILKSRKISKNKNTITINNGIVMKRINCEEEIPEGWSRGRIKLNIKKTWYTNGLQEKCFKETESIPKDWFKGRKKK